MPYVVFGLAFFGAAAGNVITALYVFIAEVLINREISFRELPRIVREAMVLVGGILMILGVSLASTNYMIEAEVPQRLLALVAELVSSPTSFLILLLVFLLVLGAILDIFSAIVLVVREVMISLFQHKLTPQDIYALSASLFVLGALRIASSLIHAKGQLDRSETTSKPA